ncbi:MAG: PilZ domain-containing protein [Sedimentisphaerales bacterium]
MKQTTNRRKAPRLRYRVTVRFSDASTGRGVTSEGQMLDVSSGGLAFRCYADESCPHEGQQLVTQFSIPNSEVQGRPKMQFARIGCVLRVQQVNPSLRNVAVRFDEPLPVGKVFFDTIGLFFSTPQDRAAVTDGRPDADKDSLLGPMLEQRIRELEHEVAELRQLQRRHAQSVKTASS